MNIKLVLRYSVIVLLFLPILLMVGWSVNSSWPWPNLLPTGFTLRGFKYAISPSTEGFIVLLKSMLLSIIVTIITLLISIPSAKALAFYEFWGKGLIKLLILLPLIVPIMTVAMGIHISFIKLGLANTYLGVILIHVLPGIPYGVRILMNIFEINGEKIEYQGRILGARPMQVFIYITLPIISPGLIVAGSLIYIISFSQYFITFLIGGGKIITYSMLLFPFVESGDRTMAAVLSTVFIISIIVVLFFSEKIVEKLYRKMELN